MKYYLAMTAAKYAKIAKDLLVTAIVIHIRFIMEELLRSQIYCFSEIYIGYLQRNLCYFIKPRNKKEIESTRKV